MSVTEISTAAKKLGTPSKIGGRPTVVVERVVMVTGRRVLMVFMRAEIKVRRLRRIGIRRLTTCDGAGDNWEALSDGLVGLLRFCVFTIFSL